MDPALVARARLFVDSRGAALVESGTSCWGSRKAVSAPTISSPSLASSSWTMELHGRPTSRPAQRRRHHDLQEPWIAVEDVTAADLAYRRAIERGVGQLLAL